MSETAEQMWQSVVDFCGDDDPALLISLGKCVLHGIKQVQQHERFVPHETIGFTYSTHFPMSDDTEWELTIERHR